MAIPRGQKTGRQYEYCGSVAIRSRWRRRLLANCQITPHSENWPRARCRAKVERGGSSVTGATAIYLSRPLSNKLGPKPSTANRDCGPAGRAGEGLGSAVGHCSRSDWEALRPAGRFGPTGRQPACSMTGGHRFGAEFSVRSVEINFKLPRKDDETKAPARPGLSHGIVRWSGRDTDELRK